MPTKWTPENLSDARRRHEAGESLSQIAPSMGVDPETLRKKFHDWGWPVMKQGVGKQRRHDAKFKALHERYIAGESGVALASEAGIDFANLYTAWHRRGWPVRDGQEAAALRYADTSPEYRQALTVAAHDAVRGRGQSFEHRCRIALGRERTLAHQSETEELLLNMLPVDAIPGKAVGPYNVDIAIGTVAVEIYGGTWHAQGRAAARFPQRTRYLFDHGWSVVIIWVEQARYPLTVAAAEYVIALGEFTRSNPTATAQYRVIRGNGQVIVRGCANDDHFPLKPSRERRLHLRCPHDLPTD